jgi:biotin carboxylase
VNKILVVSVQSDIQEKIERYIAHARPGFRPREVVYLVEFYSDFATKQESATFIAIDDVRDRQQIEAAFERIRALGPYDAVIHTDEYSVMLAAEMRDRLGVPGLSRPGAQLFRDKVSMKEALAGSPVRCPKLHDREELRSEGASLLPLVAKPRSYAGSKGVQILETAEQLQAVLAATESAGDAFEEFSMTDLEFEEKITGELHHLDGLVQDGRIVYFQASRYVGSCLDFLRGLPLGSVVIDEATAIAGWRDFASQTCRALAVPNGAFHLEAFLTPAGEKVFIEIGIRPGGSLVVPAHQESGGIDLEEAHFLLQLGDLSPLAREWKPRKSGWLTYPKRYDAAKNEFRVKKAVLGGQSGLATLKTARIPQAGDSASGSFAYVNSLGSFVFVGESTCEVESDMRAVLNRYILETEPRSI